MDSFCRFTVKLVLGFSVIIQILTMTVMKWKKHQITAELVHDQGDDNPRKARHNRAMVTLKAVRFWIALDFLGFAVLFIFYKIDREYFYLVHFAMVCKIIIQ